MKAIQWVKKRSVSLLAIIIMGILIFLPTGYEDALIYQGTERVRAEVLETNEDNIYSSGLIQSGEQECEVEILDGQFKGEIASATNMLSGSLEADKIFQVGDIANVVISHKDGEILSITMSDHFRIGKEIILALIFIVFLIGFAGKNGLRAIYSFIITILTIWKILVPSYLGGVNPLWVGIGITTFLTVIIIWLVYGFEKRTLAASGGAILGVLVTCVMGIIFTDQFQIHGSVMDYSETLLYAGFQNLNLTQNFMSIIFIGASGAMIDLSVDITSAVHEVVQKKPEIGWKEAVGSGMNVGRAAMGTMTTTLLLAYSGGYIALLMVFMAQGTPIDQILNYKYVSAEILETIVGSMGLVTVAPFTALVSGVLLTRKKHKEQEEKSVSSGLIKKTKSAGCIENLSSGQISSAMEGSEK